ncbi:MAG: endonuclease/exonuclease/phosphatase family metal-dependent hydrolase [Candidatus Woesearchaeota archaeon]|jgi:endonuclease/exonuclease/phosphatase family metal-dependent hydrolase
MTILIACINIEGKMHFDRVTKFIETHQPDVLCLQEIFEDDIKLFEKTHPYSKFAPHMSMNEIPKFGGGIRGIAIYSKHPFESEVQYYVGSISDGIPHEVSPDIDPRAVIITKIKKNNTVYAIATVHGMWTHMGLTTQPQKEGQQRLLAILKNHPNLVLCGDFNAPRGKEVFTEFTNYFIDNLPVHITSTLDPKLHKVKGLITVVDTFFSRGNVEVSNVQVFEGVSDHKALLATIKIKDN